MSDYEFYKEKAIDEMSRIIVSSTNQTAIVYAIIALAEAIRETKK